MMHVSPKHMPPLAVIFRIQSITEGMDRRTLDKYFAGAALQTGTVKRIEGALTELRLEQYKMTRIAAPKRELIDLGLSAATIDALRVSKTPKFLRFRLTDVQAWRKEVEDGAT